MPSRLLKRRVWIPLKQNDMDDYVALSIFVSQKVKTCKFVKMNFIAFIETKIQGFRV